MTLFDTIDYLIGGLAADLQEISWEIREETNFENNAIDYLSERYDIVKQQRDDLEKIKSELARLQRYDDELSSVMPEDYKDWWQNSKEEWPLVAKSSIESLREREEIAWQQVEFAYEELEAIK